MDQDWFKNVNFENEMYEDEQIEIVKKNKLLVMEEKNQDLYFEIRDYLRDVHEIDLLFHLDIDDIALLLFNQDYINKCKAEE